MLKQNYDQEQVSQQFFGLKKALFDGQLICKSDHKLSLYFSYGGIFYASRSNTKQWLQKVLLHFPQLSGENLLGGLDIQASVDCWEYHLLFTLIESNQITKSQARQLIWVIVSETLYDMWSSHTSPEFFQSELKGLLVPPVTTFDPQTILSEIKVVVEVFKSALIIGNPFNLAPALTWQKSVPEGFEKIASLIDGQRTVWDLAAMRDVALLPLVQEIISLKQTGVLKLIAPDEESSTSDLELQSAQSLPENWVLPATESANPATVKSLRKNQLSTTFPTFKYFRFRILLIFGGVVLTLVLIGGLTQLFQPQKMSDVKVSASLQAQQLQLYNSISEVPAPKGIFNYGGDPALTSLRSASADILARTQPQFRMRYLDPAFGNPGSREGVSMVLDGILSFSLSGLPLTDADYSKAKLRGFTLQQVPIAIDAIPFYTHPGVVMTGLSLSQLRGIYLGVIKNWNQVGGPDLPITPISIDPKTSTEIALLLQNETGAVSAVHALIAPDYSAAIRQVSVTPGAISFGSFAALKGQDSIRPLAISSVQSPSQYVQPYNINAEINTLAIQDGSYPLTHNLYVVYRHDGTDSEQAAIAYTNIMLSNQGQKLIENAGFIPLH